MVRFVEGVSESRLVCQGHLTYSNRTYVLTRSLAEIGSCVKVIYLDCRSLRCAIGCAVIVPGLHASPASRFAITAP